MLEQLLLELRRLRFYNNTTTTEARIKSQIVASGFGALATQPDFLLAGRILYPSTVMAANLNSRTQANGGMLRVSASQTSSNAPRQAAAKPLTAKLKVIVRRLAPGLSEEEFTTLLGDEWKLEQGKVDWFLYKPGKDSKEYVPLPPPSKNAFTNMVT